MNRASSEHILSITVPLGLLVRTSAALKAYDEAPSDEAARAVGVAYGLDTSDRNDS